MSTHDERREHPDTGIEADSGAADEGNPQGKGRCGVDGGGLHDGLDYFPE